MQKKVMLLSLLAIFTIMLPAKGMCAYSGTFAPSDIDIDDLDHWKYYTWGIFSSIPLGEEISSATLAIENINNWDQNANILYVHLLDTDFEGLVVGNDDNNIATGDAFAGEGLLVTTFEDLNGKPGPAENWSYDFTQEQLLTLNSYASDNRFGFGFDPDCHFYNDGVTFEVTSVPAVPEPASLCLLGLGLLGFGVKKKWLA
ncbi:PEP-CTERM sorting domain-containing protein [Candidatus Omnitrophota bacterium]